MKTARSKLWVFSILTGLLFGGGAILPGNAQTSNPEPETQTQPLPTARPAPSAEGGVTGFVEAGGNYEALSADFGHWDGGYVRTSITTGRNTWHAEFNAQNEYGDSGIYLVAGDTFTFSPQWYGSLTLGSSDGGFFWPRIRADGFMNRKWLARKQLITSVGFTYDAARDVHRDHAFSAGSTYYFSRPWIIETGVRFNISSPGRILAPSGFIAVTQGRDKHHYLVVNAGYGEEAYQLIGPAIDLTRFQSRTLSFTWRQWLGRNWGVNAVGEYYQNPFYNRGGTSLGFFKEF